MMLGHATAAILLGAAFFAPDTGTEARAMGGTGAAFTDSPIGVWYNPATLAGQKGIQVLVDGNVLFLNQTFQRAGTAPGNPGDYPGAGEAYSSVKSESPPQIIPVLLGTYSLLDDKLTLATGFVAPTGPRHAFPITGAQRYNLTEQWLVQANYGVWAGYRLNSWISVGAGFEGQLNTIEQQAVGTTADDTALPTEDPALDIRFDLTAASFFSPTGIVGVQLTPPRAKGWAFGLSYRPPANVKAAGELVADRILVEPTELEARFSTAQVVRLGASLDKKSWRAALDLVIEDWTPHKEVLLDFADDAPYVVGGILPTEIPLVHKYTTAYSVRAGGSKQLGEKMKLMAGYYVETAAVPSRTMGVDSIDNFKHGANVGIGFSLGKVQVSTAYTFVYLQPRDISDSEVPTLAPNATTGNPAIPVVANGSYEAFYNMFSVSALLRF